MAQTAARSFSGQFRMAQAFAGTILNAAPPSKLRMLRAVCGREVVYSATAMPFSPLMIGKFPSGVKPITGSSCPDCT